MRRASVVSDAFGRAVPAQPRRPRVGPERWRRYRDRTTPLVRTFHRDDLYADPELPQRHMRRAIDGHASRWRLLHVTSVDAEVNDWHADLVTLTLTPRSDRPVVP
ncbi:hypothetical protein [Phycicoccus sp.]|uniref:hypothetical protein n=1 Tax=Phycicoccus sp. TaxID=1902410 RepID=UPI002BED55C1|nr:hypothetical protein [Phycicoccus sp.]HMM95304.1 hypothetical protein [Phycicoccus sp.]